MYALEMQVVYLKRYAASWMYAISCVFVIWCQHQTSEGGVTVDHAIWWADMMFVRAELAYTYAYSAYLLCEHLHVIIHIIFLIELYLVTITTSMSTLLEQKIKESQSNQCIGLSMILIWYITCYPWNNNITNLLIL